MFDIKEQLKTLPEKPGVYLMKDASGEIIYVGKSKKLKDRVSSYFRAFNSHAPKVQTMVVNIKEFEYIITDTEMEALILEANLVKKHQPRFNILLKDDKKYPYIKVTTSEPFPRVYMTREYIRGTGKYFGPYTSVDAVNKTLEVLHKIYPIRKCNKKIDGIKVERPCLNFHIHQCIGPCKGDVHMDDYKKYIDEIMVFLSGDKRDVIKHLTDDMEKASMELEFEKAAEFRDQIMALKNLSERQKVVFESDKNQDVIGLYRDEEGACIMLFYIRDGKILGREHHIFDDVKGIESSTLIGTFMMQYYSGATFIPNEILLMEQPDDHALLSQWLTKFRGTKVSLTVPKIGEKKKLVNMVIENAKEYYIKFATKIHHEKEMSMTIMSGLKDILDLESIPRRIEAYDISNLYGIYAVGSMVVFENTKKKRSDYRRFKVKTIEGANDYGSMQEVLYRRFRRGLEEQKVIKESGISDTSKFSTFPDLLLIDGGKGQVNAVQQIMDAFGLDIPVAGMVKDDRHRTRDLVYNNELCNVKEQREIFHFITRIQDEVHRYAIEYHKSLRMKGMLVSVLDEIEGVGAKRKRALLTHLKSVDNIKNASFEELLEVPGMNKKVAQKVYDFFKKEHTSEDK